MNHFGKSLAKTSPTGTVIKALLNVNFFCETRKKCIGNCSTANVLCKQLRTGWCRSKIVENYGTIRETAEKTLGRNPRDNPGLDDKTAEKLPRLKEVDTIPDESFFLRFYS